MRAFRPMCGDTLVMCWSELRELIRHRLDGCDASLRLVSQFARRMKRHSSDACGSFRRVLILRCGSSRICTCFAPITPMHCTTRLKLIRSLRRWAMPLTRPSVAGFARSGWSKRINWRPLAGGICRRRGGRMQLRSLDRRTNTHPHSQPRVEIA